MELYSALLRYIGICGLALRDEPLVAQFNLFLYFLTPATAAVVLSGLQVYIASGVLL